MNYNGKKIVITGAASGIGKEMVQLLQSVPCEVLAVDLNPQALHELKEEFKSGNFTLHLYEADLSSEAGNEGLLQHCVQLFGKTDIFIANAGFAYYQSFPNTASWQKLQSIYQLNVFSPIYSLKRLWELQKSPFTMVFTASAMGIIPVPGYAIYASTKAAVRSFDEAIRYELPDQIHLCVVYPVSTRTSFFKYGDKQAPVPWPSQKASTVASQIIKKIERKRIYPSGVFQSLYLIYSLFHFLFKPYQWFYAKAFRKWLNTHYSADASSGWK